MNKKIILVFLLLFIANNSISQNKDCYPNCNITFQQIESMRIPTNQVIESIYEHWKSIDQRVSFKVSGVPVLCVKDIEDLLKSYREEDLNHWQYLKNQACSHQTGWVEKNPGACGAGGPPPCCPIDHWIKSSQSWQIFVQNMQKVYDERYNKIKSMIDRCAEQQKNNDNNRIESASKYNDIITRIYTKLSNLKSGQYQKILQIQTKVTQWKTETEQIEIAIQEEINKHNQCDFNKINSLGAKLSKIEKEIDDYADSLKNNNQSGTQNNNYNNSYNSSSNTSVKPSTNQGYYYNSSNDAQTQTANAIKNYWNQYDKKKEAIEQDYQTQSQMITTLGNTGMNLMSNIIDKIDERDRQQRLMQQARDAYNRKDQQAEQIKSTLIKLVKDLDSELISNYNVKKSPTTILPSDNFSCIYFVSFAHDFKFDVMNNHIDNPYATIYKNDYTMKIYKLYPNQDGSWMYKNDIVNKIQFKDFEDAEGSKSVLYGYYTNVDEPLQMINQVSEKTKSAFGNENFKLSLNLNVDTIEINSKNTNKASSSPSKSNSQDFWKQ